MSVLSKTSGLMGSAGPESFNYIETAIYTRCQSECRCRQKTVPAIYTRRCIEYDPHENRPKAPSIALQRAGRPTRRGVKGRVAPEVIGRSGQRAAIVNETHRSHQMLTFDWRCEVEKRRATPGGRSAGHVTASAACLTRRSKLWHLLLLRRRTSCFCEEAVIDPTRARQQSSDRSPHANSRSPRNWYSAPAWSSLTFDGRTADASKEDELIRRILQLYLPLCSVMW